MIFQNEAGAEKAMKALARTWHFWEWWLGRPCCVVCGWNAVELDKSGGGYPEYYPESVWENHVISTHPLLLNGKKFKSWGKKKGGYIWKRIKNISPENLDYDK